MEDLYGPEARKKGGGGREREREEEKENLLLEKEKEKYVIDRAKDMFQEITPQEINNVLNGESPDFRVKANRNVPLKKAISELGASLFFLAFTIIFVVIFLMPIFMGEEAHITINDIPIVVGPENLISLIILALIIGAVVLASLRMTCRGFYSLLSKGAWHIGTAKRLIIYRRNNIRSIDWEQFSGNIEVNGNSQGGDISLYLRTGKMVSQGDWPDKYVPDVIYISGIPNVFEIEQICRKRIKENDPTPPVIN